MNKDNLHKQALNFFGDYEFPTNTISEICNMMVDFHLHMMGKDHLPEAGKETAIKFAEWLRTEGWASDIGFSDTWRLDVDNVLGKIIYEYKTTEELYEIWKKQTK